MSWAVHFDPPAFPGEVWTACADTDRVRAVVVSLGKLDIDVTDVTFGGESLTVQEFKEIMGE